MTPTTETWRPVPGFAGYEVSDYGNVRSLDRLIPDGYGGLRQARGRVLKPQINRRTGRRMVDLRFGDGRKVRTIYTLVLEAFVGPRPPGTEACHGDGNPQNDNLANLRWDTRRANNLDRVRHGTHNMARRTHCPRNHRLEQPNLAKGALASGRRSCLACHRAHGDHVAADQHYSRIMRNDLTGAP